MTVPDGGEIIANATVTFAEKLASYDGQTDFSGSSGINLTKSATSGDVRYSSDNIKGFLAGSAGETVQLNGVAESRPSTVISGTAYYAVKTISGASVCLHYYYD